MASPAFSWNDEQSKPPAADPRFAWHDEPGGESPAPVAKTSAPAKPAPNTASNPSTVLNPRIRNIPDPSANETSSLGALYHGIKGGAALASIPASVGLTIPSAIGGAVLGGVGSYAGDKISGYAGASPLGREMSSDLGGLAGGYLGGLAGDYAAPKVVGRLSEYFAPPRGEILPPSTDQLPGRPYVPRPRAVSPIAPIPQREGLALPPGPAPRPEPAWRGAQSARPQPSDLTPIRPEVAPWEARNAARPAPPPPPPARPAPAWRTAEPAPAQAPPAVPAPTSRATPEQIQALRDDFRLKRTFTNAKPIADPEAASQADFARHSRAAQQEILRNNTIIPPTKGELVQQFRAANPPTGYSPAPYALSAAEEARLGPASDIAPEVKAVRQADVDRRVKFGRPEERIPAVQENAEIAAPEVQDKGFQRANDLSKRKYAEERPTAPNARVGNPYAGEPPDFAGARASQGAQARAAKPEAPVRTEATPEEKMRIAREMREGKHKWRTR